MEAVKLIQERGVSVAQAVRDFGVHETVLRRWVQESAPSALARATDQLLMRVRASFFASDRTYWVRLGTICWRMGCPVADIGLSG